MTKEFSVIDKQLSSQTTTQAMLPCVFLHRRSRGCTLDTATYSLSQTVIKSLDIIKKPH